MVKRKLLTIDELIDYLPVKYVKGSITNMVSKGEIKATKFGRTLLFDPDDIDKFIKNKFK